MHERAVVDVRCEALQRGHRGRRELRNVDLVERVAQSVEGGDVAGHAADQHKYARQQLRRQQRLQFTRKDRAQWQRCLDKVVQDSEPLEQEGEHGVAVEVGPYRRRVAGVRTQRGDERRAELRHACV